MRQEDQVRRLAGVRAVAGGGEGTGQMPGERGIIRRPPGQDVGREGSRARRGGGGSHDHGDPPPPPFEPGPLTAIDPGTDPADLWGMARDHPELRRWLVANPAASPALLETISQMGGPGVRRALEVLLEALEDP